LRAMPLKSTTRSRTSLSPSRHALESCLYRSRLASSTSMTRTEVSSTTCWGVAAAAWASSGMLSNRARPQLMTLRIISLLLVVFADGVEQEAADQFLEHQRRLGIENLVTILQHQLITAYGDADVFFTQQTGGHDRGRAVRRQRVHIGIDGHLDQAGVPVLVEGDAFDLTDGHARHGYLGAGGQAGHVIEVGIYGIAVP